MTDRTGKLFVLTSALLWSTGGMCIKLLADLGPWAVAGGRSFLALLLLLALLRGRVLPSRARRPLITLGAVLYALVVTGFVVANLLTSAANAIILQYAAPLWIAIGGWLFLRERPSTREMTALLIGGAGVIVCFAPNLTLTMTGALLGDVVALGSGVAFAALTVVLRRLGRDAPPGDDTASLHCILWGNAITAAVGVPMLIAAAGAGHVTALGWLLLMWLGFAQLGGGYWFFQRGVRVTRALTASLLCFLEPVLNPVWVMLVIGEIPPPWTLIGGGAVLAAVATLLLTSDAPRG